LRRKRRRRRPIIGTAVATYIVDNNSPGRKPNAVLLKGFLNTAEHLAPQYELLSGPSHELDADDKG
jgi:hypothetical protein